MSDEFNLDGPPIYRSVRMPSLATSPPPRFEYNFMPNSECAYELYFRRTHSHVQYLLATIYNRCSMVAPITYLELRNQVMSGMAPPILTRQVNISEYVHYDKAKKVAHWLIDANADGEIIVNRLEDTPYDKLYKTLSVMDCIKYIFYPSEREQIVAQYGKLDNIPEKINDSMSNKHLLRTFANMSMVN